MPTGSSQTIPVRLTNAAFFRVSGGQAQVGWGGGLGELSPRWAPPVFGFLVLSFQVLLEKAPLWLHRKRGKGKWAVRAGPRGQQATSSLRETLARTHWVSECFGQDPQTPLPS